jgi:hypothetical protein
MAAPTPKVTHAAIMSPFPARSGASYSLSASWGIYRRNWIPHASTSPLQNSPHFYKRPQNLRVDTLGLQNEESPCRRLLSVSHS